MKDGRFTWFNHVICKKHGCFFSFRHCEVGQVIEQLDRDGSGAFDISESLGTVENLGDFISCFADVMVEDYVDLEI